MTSGPATLSRPALEAKAAGDEALRRGDARSAEAWFREAAELDPSNIETWLGLAAARRGLKDLSGAIAAVDGALRHEPRNFLATLMRASLLEAAGDVAGALQYYGFALANAPPAQSLPASIQGVLARARTRHEAHVEALARELLGAIEGVERLPGEERRRLECFSQIVAGRRRAFNAEPLVFHYPRLPAIEFFEREAFPWIEAFESRTEAIRREMLAVWAADSEDLVPYLNYADSLPLDQWAELNASRRWSAYHLVEKGRRDEAHCRACPATMAAAALLDAPVIEDASPTVMFSILSPRTRIPPHTGASNTRLVVHLPLVVPPGCGFRVGGETRAWRPGEAFAFDDTIEHEAWNDSDEPRGILICDTWNPLLSSAEREMITRLMARRRAFMAATGNAA